MRLVVTDSGVTNGRRAHLWIADCWCHPRVDGDVIVHRNVMLRHDTQPRMAVYSDD